MPPNARRGAPTRREELALRFRAAAALVGTAEVIVQELIPGESDSQLAYCAFFKDGTARASMIGAVSAAASRRVRTGQHVCPHGRAP